MGRQLPPHTILNKGIAGFGVVGFTGLDKRLGPLGVIYGVGIELGFQSDAAALAVVHTVFAVVVQEITGVNLNAGAIGGNGHGTAGNGIVENGTGVAENLKIVADQKRII